MLQKHVSQYKTAKKSVEHKSFLMLLTSDINYMQYFKY